MLCCIYVNVTQLLLVKNVTGGSWRPWKINWITSTYLIFLLSQSQITYFNVNNNAPLSLYTMLWGPVNCNIGYLFPLVQTLDDPQGPIYIHGHGSWSMWKATLTQRWSDYIPSPTNFRSWDLCDSHELHIVVSTYAYMSIYLRSISSDFSMIRTCDLLRGKKQKKTRSTFFKRTKFNHLWIRPKYVL